MPPAVGTVPSAAPAVTTVPSVTVGVKANSRPDPDAVIAPGSSHAGAPASGRSSPSKMPPSR
jgi:hypothetical protein